MDLTERYDAVTAKMDELRAKLEESNEAVKESFKQGAADFRADMEFNQNSIDEILEEAKREHDIRVEERIDDIIATDEAFEARKEERREAARAKIKNLQDKINDLGQAYARADQEELIVDLLTYADECQEIAIYMSEEAILAYKAAAEQIALYYEKYGEN
jgi:NADH dehydrogenase/NADH:ubiquinone oxidoreductase subunit G